MGIIVNRNGRRLAFVAVLPIFLVTFNLLFQSVAFGQQDVKISPVCGPKSGFNIEISADGFTPNTNVNWQLVGSDENVPLYGYFQTNSAGSITDTTFADDLKKDLYKMYFGEDANNDGQIDASVIPVYVELNIPCSKED
jgi:hypothetical protein